MSKTFQVIKTDEKIILTVSDCVDLMLTAKKGEPLHFYIILWYTDRQYSAYVHCT